MSSWGETKRLYASEWTGPDILTCFSAIADEPYSLLFDSARPENPLSRYSFACWHPLETIESKNGRVTVTNRERQMTTSSNPFDILRDRLMEWEGSLVAADANLPPFQGGAAGFFGYDLGREVESIGDTAQDNPAMPDMAVGIYGQVLAFDHREGKACLLLRAESREDAYARKTKIMKTISDRAARVRDFHPFAPEWDADCTDAVFVSKVKKVVEMIYAGDMFQANISRRFSAELPKGFDPFAHYLTLREVNPAPFAAYMNFGQVKIASSSPERFLQVRGRHVETRPIKGTRRAEQDPASDRIVRDALLFSEKDRSENAMIVDLMRNDISKACEDHSIEVPQLCTLETMEGLHHLVSVVTGQLRADQTPVDLLKGCFPGGSVTGAPKVQAMRVIEQMEPFRRGPYCGCLGYIGAGGMMDTNIAIRTLIYSGNTVSLQTGAGIVAKSNPQQELDETLAKAEKLFESFKGHHANRKTA